MFKKAELTIKKKKADPYFTIFLVGRKRARANKHLFSLGLMLNLSGFMCSFEKRKFYAKILSKFSYGEIVLSAHGMKSDEKPFYVKFMQFFEGKLYIL